MSTDTTQSAISERQTATITVTIFRRRKIKTKNRYPGLCVPTTFFHRCLMAATDTIACGSETAATALLSKMRSSDSQRKSLSTEFHGFNDFHTRTRLHVFISFPLSPLLSPCVPSSFRISWISRVFHCFSFNFQVCA